MLLGIGALAGVIALAGGDLSDTRIVARASLSPDGGGDDRPAPAVLAVDGHLVPDGGRSAEVVIGLCLSRHQP